MARSSFVTVVCTCTLTTHTRQWTDALDTNGATVQYSCHVVVPSIKHHSESKLSLISRTVVWLPHFSLIVAAAELGLDHVEELLSQIAMASNARSSPSRIPRLEPHPLPP